MKIINLLGASLLMVSPFTFAKNSSEEGFLSTEIPRDQARGFATTNGAIKFATYAASSAATIRSTGTYSYGGAGCESNNTASSIFLDESLNIPVGSIIVSAGLFYRDNSTGGARLELFNTDSQGSFGVDVNILGPTISGAGSIGQFLWLPTESGISNVARFTMSADPSADACMARIGYIPFDVADDVIYATKYEY